MLGVTTQASDPKISTACTAALKNNPDTHSAAPSLLNMHNILLRTFLARDKLITTAIQLTYDAYIPPPPKYLKEVTISRGRPQALKSMAVTTLTSPPANYFLFL